MLIFERKLSYLANYTRLNSALVLLVLFLMDAAGCAGRQQWSAVSIRVIGDTALLQRTANSSSFHITVIIRNDSPQPLYGGGCGPDAERKIGEKWVTVWTPVCADGLVATLQPGDSAVVPVMVLGFTRPNAIPQLDPRFGPGLYRLVFKLALERRGGNSPMPKFHFRRSTTFVVKDATGG